MFLVHTGCKTADVDTGRDVIEQQFAGKIYEFVIEIQVQIAWFLYINIKQALYNDFNDKLHTEKCTPNVERNYHILLIKSVKLFGTVSLYSSTTKYYIG